MGALGPSRGSWAQGAPSAELDSVPWHLSLGALCAPCGCSLPLSQKGWPLLGCIEQPGNHRLFTLFLLRPESLPCSPPSLRVSGLRTTQTEPQASLTWLGAMDRVSTAATTVYLLRSPECSQDALSMRAGAFSWPVPGLASFFGKPPQRKLTWEKSQVEPCG